MSCSSRAAHVVAKMPKDEYNEVLKEVFDSAKLYIHGFSAGQDRGGYNAAHIRDCRLLCVLFMIIFLRGFICRIVLLTLKEEFIL